jgi:hypothetical protein
MNHIQKCRSQELQNESPDFRFVDGCEPKHSPSIWAVNLEMDVGGLSLLTICNSCSS